MMRPVPRSVSAPLRLAALALAALLPGLAARADVPKVVTDIPPVHALVAQVMGDLGRPELLLTQGASEHDFQLRPSQAATLSEADLVVWIGPELTPWLDKALQGLAADAVQMSLLSVPQTLLRPYADQGAHSEEEGEDHDHGPTDPHAWLDPDNARLWLGAIAAELGQLDPDHAATYQANAARAVADLDRMDGDLTIRLSAMQGRPIVVFHDAYGYLAAHYGLTILGSISLGDATAPGAARLAELGASAKAGQIACVFAEQQHDPALAAQLAQDSGARLGAALDPVGSTLPPGPALYGALLTGMANAILDCAGT